jgi:hypothetical protein
MSTLGTAHVGVAPTAMAYASDGRTDRAAAARETAAVREFSEARRFAFWAHRHGLRPNADVLQVWQRNGSPW